mmetsp:Transcript_44824/g.101223  ORF Transcript_44824/g.101223 Transcript_44824/m.101223 type:complete len:247 (-) Transcript_44824:959-1699(-)
MAPDWEPPPLLRGGRVLIGGAREGGRRLSRDVDLHPSHPHQRLAPLLLLVASRLAELGGISSFPPCRDSHLVPRPDPDDAAPAASGLSATDEQTHLLRSGHRAHVLGLHAALHVAIVIAHSDAAICVQPLYHCRVPPRATRAAARRLETRKNLLANRERFEGTNEPGHYAFLGVTILVRNVASAVSVHANDGTRIPFGHLRPQGGGQEASLDPCPRDEMNRGEVNAHPWRQRRSGGASARPRLSVL